jgi:hypothetical protein
VRWEYWGSAPLLLNFNHPAPAGSVQRAELRTLVFSVLIGVAPILGACDGSICGDAIAGPEKLAQQDEAYCQSIGTRFGTPEYSDCQLIQQQTRKTRHAREPQWRIQPPSRRQQHAVSGSSQRSPATRGNSFAFRSREGAPTLGSQ